MIAMPPEILDQYHAIIDRSTAGLIDALARLQPYDQSPERVSPLILARGDAEKARWSAMKAASPLPPDMVPTFTSQPTLSPIEILRDEKLREATAEIASLRRDLDRATVATRELEANVARLQFDNTRLRELVSVSENQSRDAAERERELETEVQRLRAENIRLDAENCRLRGFRPAVSPSDSPDYR